MAFDRIPVHTVYTISARSVSFRARDGVSGYEYSGSEPVDEGQPKQTFDTVVRVSRIVARMYPEPAHEHSQEILFA